MEGRPYDEGAATAPMSREAMGGYSQPMHPQMGYGPESYGYGYGAPWNRGGGFGRRRPITGPIETKPFFLTSEFLATILGVLAIGIVASTADDIDSRLAMILVTALLSAYVISRGIAKAATRSNSFDPREQLLSRAAEHTAHHTHDGA